MTTPRSKLALLALLFIAPLAAAFVAYTLGWFEGGKGTHGTLISPARPLPALQLADAAGAPAPAALAAGKWSLVYLGGAPCEQACMERIVLTRQVRLALAKNRERLQRVYVAVTDAGLAQARAQLAEQHHDMVFLVDRGPAGQRASDFFQPTDPQGLFLVDPLGNWVMAYAGPVEAKGLHRDLRKLLRFSQVG